MADLPPRPPPSTFSLEYLHSLPFWTRFGFVCLLCLFSFSAFANFLQNNEEMQEQLRIYRERQAEWEREKEAQPKPKVKKAKGKKKQ